MNHPATDTLEKNLSNSVELKGIEPSASRVRFWRSPKLSYSPIGS